MTLVVVVVVVVTVWRVVHAVAELVRPNIVQVVVGSPPATVLLFSGGAPTHTNPFGDQRRRALVGRGDLRRGAPLALTGDKRQSTPQACSSHGLCHTCSGTRTCLRNAI
jgi:hypothetical protein